MWRYYAVATLLVVAAGSLAFAHRIATLRDLHVQATPRAGQTPTVGRAAPRESGAPGGTFRGAGSWAMSALPDCFDELRSVVGASALVAAKIPPATERLRAGTRVAWNDCTLTVGDDDVRIARGADRLRVPPHAALYRLPRGELVLVWSNDEGRTEIRTYARP